MKTKKGYRLRSLGDESLLVPENPYEAIDFSRMISLNASAAFLWKEVEDKDFDAETLVNLLMEGYGIDHDTAQHDVEALLQSWENAGIIIN